MRSAASPAASRSNMGPCSQASMKCSDVARGLELVGHGVVGLAPSLARRRILNARGHADEDDAAQGQIGAERHMQRHPGTERVAEQGAWLVADGRPHRLGHEARGRRQVGPHRAGTAVAGQVHRDQRVRSRPGARRSGPRAVPVWVKPCSTTSGGPEPRTSTWSGTPGERTGHLQRHPGRRVGRGSGSPMRSSVPGRGRRRWRCPWLSDSGSTSASTSAVRPSSRWGWRWRPGGRPSSASRAARPRPSCIRRSSRRTTPGSRSSSARRTGRPSCTTPERRRPSSRTGSSRRRPAGRSRPACRPRVRKRRGDPWRSGPSRRRSTGRRGPGPVHLNLEFREPLTGSRRRPCRPRPGPVVVVAGRATGRPPPAAGAAAGPGDHHRRAAHAPQPPDPARVLGARRSARLAGPGRSTVGEPGGGDDRRRRRHRPHGAAAARDAS